MRSSMGRRPYRDACRRPAAAKSRGPQRARPLAIGITGRATSDARVSRSPRLTGEGVTITDIAVATPMHVHAALRFELAEHPNLER